MQFADSHCHPHLAPLDADSDAVIARGRAQGVAHFLCVAVSLRDAAPLHRLAMRHPEVCISVGVHPNEPEGETPSEAVLIEAAKAPAVVAIGETGLDYYRSPEGALAWQQERFRRHIRAARVAGKPLIIHTRDAAQDTLRILREEGAEEVGGVMHCFTESVEVARAALDIGFYISFSGIVTFRNAESLRGVARMVPEERLLIETDAPYLAPAPHRGTTNEPALVVRVAEVMAEVRGTSLASIAATTRANFLRLFAPSGQIRASGAE